MLELIIDLERVKEHLMAHDGWTRRDVETINSAIKIIEGLLDD